MVSVKAPDTGRIWELYQNGLDAHSAINLLDTINRNERFLNNDQWHGIQGNGLPKPVINFIDKAVQYKTSTISNTKPKIVFIANQMPSEVVTPDAVQQTGAQTYSQIQYWQQLQKEPDTLPQSQDIISTEADAALLSGVFEVDFERLRLRDKFDDGLMDACISGNMILYNYWDDKADTGQTSKGAIAVQLIDSVNFFPTDEQQQDVQKQPSIIISQRELLSSVKAQAKAYGMSQSGIDNITDDSENYNNAGDMAQKEVQDDDAKKVVTLMYFWKDAESGHIYCVKTTRNAVIRPAWDTLLTRYPFAVMAWKPRKNSIYGRSEIEGLIPNQIEVNRTYAMMMLSIRLTAFPRVMYNPSQIKKWNNNISEAIQVNGGDMNNAVKYLIPPDMSNQAFTVPENVIKLTLEMMGANEAAVGTAPTYNASANSIAISQTTTPLTKVMRRYYGLLKDFALNWLDMALGYINAPRWVFPHTDSGRVITSVFDPEKLRERLWNLTVEVGQAPDFSYTALLQQMGQWVQSGQMQLKNYIALCDDSVLGGHKQEFLNLLQQQEQQMQAQAMQLAQQKLQSQQSVQQPAQIPQQGGVMNG